MSESFTALELASAILIDHFDKNSQMFLQLSDRAQKLVDAFLPKSCPDDIKGKTLRATLDTKVSGGSCVQPFYIAVLAFEDRPDIEFFDRNARVDEIKKLSEAIIGDSRSVEMP